MQSLAINKRNRERAREGNDYSVHDESNFKNAKKKKIKKKFYWPEKSLSI